MPGAVNINTLFVMCKTLFYYGAATIMCVQMPRTVAYVCFVYFETLSFSFGRPTADAIAVTGEVHRQWISLIIITVGNVCPEQDLGITR